jgi:hypothetical protein
VIQVNIGNGILSLKFGNEKDKEKWLAAIQAAIKTSQNILTSKRDDGIQTRHEVEIGILKRQSQLDSSKIKMKEKLQVFRDTVNQLSKLKGGVKKDKPYAELVEKLKLQVDEVENIYNKDVDEMHELVEDMQQHITVEGSILVKSALPNMPHPDNEDDNVDNEMSVGDFDHEKLEVNENKNDKYTAKDDLGISSSKLQKPLNKVKYLTYDYKEDNEQEEKNEEEEEEEKIRFTEKIEVGEIVIEDYVPENSSPNALSDENNSNEEEKIGDEDKEEISDVEDDDSQYYDAIDHMIYDELEQSVYESNQRRPTVFISHHSRTTLPALKPKASINIFKILKSSIGKDLTSF